MHTRGSNNTAGISKKDCEKNGTPTPPHRVAVACVLGAIDGNSKETHALHLVSLDSILARLDAAEEYTTISDMRFVASDERFAAMKECNTGFAKRISTLEAENIVLKDENLTWEERASELEKRVASLKADNTVQKKSVSKLAAKTVALKKEVRNLEHQIMFAPQQM